ncbi:tetratricopeptide repeat protein, partial [Streptomyces sp. NPDC001633]|uniref:tetratricopeptide repeat protein n=1 Tax=Streptomyces sp. NPDC001633 TaxID=3364595 RepID=UPI0036931A89
MIQSGNATASHGGIAVTGIFSPTVNLPPETMRPPAQVDAPVGLDDLPYRPAQFVGRSRALDQLDAALSTPGTVLVHGLGGIGKSTLAAHWAATHPHGCTPVRWIAADSFAAVQQGLASLATALQPALAHALPAEALTEYGLQWLASHTGWLLIVDNVNDPADISWLIARAHGGRFLITSRLTTTWSNTTTVRLDVLEEGESLALLTRITSAIGPRDLDGAADLCAELGHLPLAIEQAAAYLAQNPLTTPHTYLDMLAQHPTAMYGQGGANTPAERTIARIWDITLDRITTVQPLAADLLRILAWYAPEHIPTTLVDGVADPPALNAAIGLLTAYNMITPDADTGTLAVHRLVQAIARTPDPNDPHRTPHDIDRAREHATDNLYGALPDDVDAPATWPTWRALLPHIDALVDHTTSDTDTTASILHWSGIFLATQGQHFRGITHLQRALRSYEQAQGADHPRTLACRHNLAGACAEAGDLGRAIAMYEQTLADKVQVLGADHPDTLASRHSLATAYTTAGDLRRAIALHEQTLADRARVLGEDHPDTLASRHNLGNAYEEAGDPVRAIALHEQTLADEARVLGEDHLDTLASRNNLALAYAASGDLRRAIALHEQTLADRARVLGEDHPGTLTSRNNLALAYAASGDLRRAIALHEQTLADRARVLGEDH